MIITFTANPSLDRTVDLGVKRGALRNTSRSMVVKISLLALWAEL